MICFSLILCRTEWMFCSVARGKKWDIEGHKGCSTTCRNTHAINLLELPFASIQGLSCRELFTWKMPAAEHFNWVIKVSRECVFICNPLILQGLRELITNLKTGDLKWVIKRSEKYLTQEFNNGRWHGRVLSVFVVKCKCKNGKNAGSQEGCPLFARCFPLWIVLIWRSSTSCYIKLNVLPVRSAVNFISPSVPLSHCNGFKSKGSGLLLKSKLVSLSSEK